MAETATLSRFEVIFDAEGVNNSKFRNDIKLINRRPLRSRFEGWPNCEGLE
jgi:hypothetical protein